MHRFTLFILALFVLGGMMFAGDAKPFTAHDLVTMKRISSPSISPDGQWIVYGLRTTDMKANKGRTDLWLIGVHGNGRKQLTTDPAGDFNPLWGPEGEWIYFLSTRSGSSQVWKISINGGAPVQVTKLPMGVGNLILSPAGTQFAFTLDVFPGKSVEETLKIQAKRKASKATGRVYDRLFIRHWDTWKDGTRSHVFVMPVAGGPAVDVMKKMDADSPSKPFGGSEEFVFTPDGKGIVFTARDAGLKEAWSTNFDLFYAPCDASVEPKCLTEKNKAWDTAPLFSPDGKTLAYLAMKRVDFEADRFYIVLRNWADGSERILAESWDRSAGSITWGPKGKKLYVVAGDVGQRTIFALDIKKDTAQRVVSDGQNGLVGFAGKEIIYSRAYFKSPTELYALRIKGKKQTRRQITFENKEKLAALKMGDYEQFNFKGWNDETVYGYVVKPVDFDAAKKYPVVFMIHGGPQGSFGNKFHYRWNPQPYCGQGYAVVMVDFHGSTGYGQAFTDSITGDWGGKPLEDLQKGLAYAVKTYPWLDGERVGALGASYGGYMINWIAGNWPDRFKCLVNHDGNLDERLAYFDTEELWFPEWEHGGTPWDNPKGYEEHNPVNFVKNWKTPMLVIHGALDFRVVETQGMSTFTALQRKGIPSKLLYFPDENHWVLKPHNSVFWHKTVLDWLDQWVKK